MTVNLAIAVDSLAPGGVGVGYEVRKEIKGSGISTFKCIAFGMHSKHTETKASGANENLCVTLGNEVVNVQTCKMWFAKFCSGDFSRRRDRLLE